MRQFGAHLRCDGVGWTDLKLEAPDVEEQELQYVVLIDLLRQLSDDLWLWLVL